MRHLFTSLRPHLDLTSLLHRSICPAVALQPSVVTSKSPTNYLLLLFGLIKVKLLRPATADSSEIPRQSVSGEINKAVCDQIVALFLLNCEALIYRTVSGWWRRSFITRSVYYWSPKHHSLLGVSETTSRTWWCFYWVWAYRATEIWSQ